MYNEMMTGEKVAYILIQSDNGKDTPLSYADYNGEFSMTDMGSATRFGESKLAVDLAVMKNKISTLMNSKLQFKVISETLTRKEVSLETGVPMTPLEPSTSIESEPVL